jgi:tripartite-type tricarboxylate transporter receptor subunit TctC
MKLDMTHIAYKGCAPAVADILGNHVPVFFQTLSNVTENWKSGRLRVLAVSDPTRLLDFPDLPTMIEAGVPNFLVTPWYGIFAPTGTPKEIISKMNLDIAKVVNGSELNAILKKAHYAPETMTTEQFSKLVVTDIERLGKVIKSAGMTPD